MRKNTYQRRRPKGLADESAACLHEFEEHLTRIGRPQYAKIGTRAARHLLVWLELDGIEIEHVDDTVIRRFRDHRCVCPPRMGPTGLYKLNAAPPRATMHGVQRFVQFLEESGRVQHPDELNRGRELLEAFLDRASSQGHSPNMLSRYRSLAQHLLLWLHRSRISTTELTAKVLGRFFQHDCVCPGKFRGFANGSASSDTVYGIRKFVRFLASREMAPEVHLVRKKPLNADLHDFHVWLRRHRGLGELAIRDYDREVSALMVDLGKNPETYDAALVRRVLLARFATVTKSHAQRLVSFMRMYLRYLSSKGACPPSLVGAVPRVAVWSLSTLPRYLPMTDIERVIASCDGSRPADIRNRAIFLLLARLALRAIDVRLLQLDDIDWDNAEIAVRGKSDRPVRLPLPQDVGDALLDYIENDRPRVEDRTVFIRVRPPHRPFAYSTAISIMVRKALKRAGVESPGGHGAHIFRHSSATHLVRTGETLETVGVLLRHRRLMTTQVYAKVDVPMLQQVAQPWMGDVR